MESDQRLPGNFRLIETWTNGVKSVIHVPLDLPSNNTINSSTVKDILPKSNSFVQQGVLVPNLTRGNEDAVNRATNLINSPALIDFRHSSQIPSLHIGTPISAVRAKHSLTSLRLLSQQPRLAQVRPLVSGNEINVENRNSLFVSTVSLTNPVRSTVTQVVNVSPSIIPKPQVRVQVRHPKQPSGFSVSSCTIPPNQMIVVGPRIPVHQPPLYNKHFSININNTNYYDIHHLKPSGVNIPHPGKMCTVIIDPIDEDHQSISEDISQVFSNQFTSKSVESQSDVGTKNKNSNNVSLPNTTSSFKPKKTKSRKKMKDSSVQCDPLVPLEKEINVSKTDGEIILIDECSSPVKTSNVFSDMPEPCPLQEMSKEKSFLQSLTKSTVPSSVAFSVASNLSSSLEMNFLRCGNNAQTSSKEAEETSKNSGGPKEKVSQKESLEKSLNMALPGNIKNKESLSNFSMHEEEIGCKNLGGDVTGVNHGFEDSTEKTLHTEHIINLANIKDTPATTKISCKDDSETVSTTSNSCSWHSEDSPILKKRKVILQKPRNSQKVNKNKFIEKLSNDKSKFNSKDKNVLKLTSNGSDGQIVHAHEMPSMFASYLLCPISLDMTKLKSKFPDLSLWSECRVKLEQLQLQGVSVVNIKLAKNLLCCSAKNRSIAGNPKETLSSRTVHVSDHSKKKNGKKRKHVH